MPHTPVTHGATSAGDQRLTSLETILDDHHETAPPHAQHWQGSDSCRCKVRRTPVADLVRGSR